MLLIDGPDKVLCGMHKSLIIETLYEVSSVFRKESFINAKKVLNFIQSLINERKVIKFLTALLKLQIFSKDAGIQAVILGKQAPSVFFLRDFGKIFCCSFIKNKQQINRVLMKLQQIDGTAELRCMLKNSNTMKHNKGMIRYPSYIHLLN